MPLVTDKKKKELIYQGVTDARRVSIKRDGQMIQTNTYIIRFNSPEIPTSIRIGYENKQRGSI